LIESKARRGNDVSATFDEIAILAQGHGSGRKADVKPDGKVTSVLLLGASGFLGPALRDAFGAERAVMTHLSHSGEGSLFFDACALGIMPMFVSSDAVFDGSRAYWSEDDEPIPILTNGRQKLEVERHLAALPPPWIIVRLPKLISPERNARCFLSGWAEGLGRRGRILCGTDQHFTSAAVPNAARAIAQLVQARALGLYHLGGSERLSRRAPLGAVLGEYRKFEKPMTEVVECSLRDIPVLEPRPLDTSLRSDRFKADFGTPVRVAGEVARAAVPSYFAAQDGGK